MLVLTLLDRHYIISPAMLSKWKWSGPALAAAAYLVYWQVVPRLYWQSVGAILASTVVALTLTVVLASETARSLVSTRAILFSTIIALVCYGPIAVMYALHKPIIPWIYVLFVPGLRELLFLWLAS